MKALLFFVILLILTTSALACSRSSQHPKAQIDCNKSKDNSLATSIVVDNDSTSEVTTPATTTTGPMNAADIANEIAITLIEESTDEDDSIGCAKKALEKLVDDLIQSSWTADISSFQEFEAKLSNCDDGEMKSIVEQLTEPMRYVLEHNDAFSDEDDFKCVQKFGGKQKQCHSLCGGGKKRYRITRELKKAFAIFQDNLPKNRTEMRKICKDTRCQLGCIAKELSKVCWKGVSHLYFELGKKNLRAQALYASRGWSKDEEHYDQVCDWVFLKNRK